ncbi:hypothetical protein [Legionella cardiaca]|uniref:V-SNARE coiled-coil homology domain-containing protein n=1 Tax=Legionella cardiaca TaxID=1071983 RepID=A0ABY8AS52_9GAMM|nr:hypothetical protein [Legionella cardiaca]WED43348.1 hypothetical protein PXX05_00820 [Legionella cardiaca]
MKCYALGIRLDDTATSFQWLIPGSNITSFFAQKIVDKHKKEIIAFCDQLQPNETQGRQKEGYYFYIKRISSEYCVVVTDTQLDEKQMNYLSWYLLRAGIPMNIIAQDIEKYTKDYKVEDLKRELNETHKIMLDNLDKIILRGEKIETLVAKSEGLATTSFQFKKKSEELNSCWPTCVLI